jgi:hypothetical protein
LRSDDLQATRRGVDGWMCVACGGKWMDISSGREEHGGWGYDGSQQGQGVPPAPG